MNDSKQSEGFIAYVGPPELHDGAIVQVQESNEGIEVSVQGDDGKPFVIAFSGVRSISSNRPEGMILYGLAEMKDEGPGRKFVFLNWDEKDEAKLEIIAADFAVLSDS
jgi:hypothetical protein